MKKLPVFPKLTPVIFTDSEIRMYGELTFVRNMPVKVIDMTSATYEKFYKELIKRANEKVNTVGEQIIENIEELDLCTGSIENLVITDMWKIINEDWIKTPKITFSLAYNSTTKSNVDKFLLALQFYERMTTWYDEENIVWVKHKVKNDYVYITVAGMELLKYESRKKFTQKYTMGYNNFLIQFEEENNGNCTLKWDLSKWYYTFDQALYRHFTTDGKGFICQHAIYCR